MTTGPDIGCVFMMWSAFCLMLMSIRADDRRVAARCGWAAALLLFIAILWRYHALVFGVASLGAIALVHRGRVPWRASSGVLASLAIFAGLSLLPGWSPQLSRAQAFGVWEGFHAVNWYHMPTDIPSTVAGVIREDPAAFLQAYWRFHRPYLWLLVPPLVAAIALRGRQRQVATAILLLECAYVPVVGVGMSPRGIAPIAPASMLCAGLLVGLLIERISSVAPRRFVVAFSTIAICAVATRLWWTDNRAFIDSSITGYEWRRAVEVELRAQGVTAPLQVFGDAGFHFVLQPGPGWYSYLARSNGGWPRLDLYDLERLAPEINTDSLDAFIQDCARSGITHLVLGATAGGLVPDLGRLFAGQLTHHGLQETATVAGFKIFVLRG